MTEALHLLIDTSPLENANAIRGVGVYTRLLVAELEKRSELQVFTQPKSLKGQQIDLIHYPFFDLFFPTLPLHKKTKTVVTIHDVIPLVFPKAYRPGLKGSFQLQRQRLALQSVSAVITDSLASKGDIMKYLKVPEERIQVIYLAANPDLKASDPEEVTKVARKYHLPDKYILYVGDINYNKNLVQLIKSLRFLPDDLHMVCVGKNFYPQSITEWKAIETQIALSNVEEKIKFITNLEQGAVKDLAAIYGGAIAYVQPSLYEGFGFPILEAMTCKTPVVSTQNSSLVEIGGKFVQYVQTDAESIAEGVKEVLGWPVAKRQQWVDEAWRWSQNFSWSKTADQTVAVYQSVVKGN